MAINLTAERTRSGDDATFQALTDPHRRELQLHCYRMLGSTQDAEDVVQETLLAAWRGLERFDGRASVRTWLYRIATNRCLDALRAGRRRPRDVALEHPLPEPTRFADTGPHEPYPDLLLEGLADAAPGPDARYEMREAISLAFVAGLQRLPAQQRAVLVLRDVLSFPAAEVAEILDSSEASVNSALQRARAGLEQRVPANGRERAPLPGSPVERDIVGRFADAVEAGDVDTVLSLLTDDAWARMPPAPHEYQGVAAIGRLLWACEETRGVPWRLVPTRANGQPAFACYLPDPATGIAHAAGVMVLDLADGRIREVVRFADSDVFAQFGLPATLAAGVPIDLTDAKESR